MFKKVRTTILKALLKEFDNVSITECDGEVNIMIKAPFNNKKGYIHICIDIYEYGTYEDLYPEAFEEVK